MPEAKTTLEHKDPKAVSNTALKVFFNIAREWQLSSQEAMILLGNPPRSTFHKWQKGEGSVITKETLERISYVIGIYKALRQLFSSEDQANAWPKKPSRDFGGEPALNVMLKGCVVNLAEVRRYLDTMRADEF